MELCSENPSSVTMMSPRISFSQDLTQSDTSSISLSDQYLLRSIPSSSSVDFDFCVHNASDQQSSSADELFSDGKLLPAIHIKKTNTSPQTTKIRPPSPHKDSKPSNSDNSKSDTKSFWRFKRSSSLNCGGGYARSLCPLPPLSRSNSAGSASSNVKPPLKKTNMQNSTSGGYQKPPLKKGGGGGHGSVRVNSVLNVAPVNMFGFGSLFSTNKDKKKKK